MSNISTVNNASLSDENKEIFSSMINYFDLDQKTLDISIPYSLNNALDQLRNITLGTFSSELKDIVPEGEREIYFMDEKDFSVDNIQFLTSRKLENDKIEYILLHDLKKENYIATPEFTSKNQEKIDKGINIKFIKEGEKKEIHITCFVNYENFLKNILENLIKKSKFEKAQEIFEKSKEYKKTELEKENLEFKIKIIHNSINKVIYTENGEFLFDLQFPPVFMTNFLINESKSYQKMKRDNYTYYENIFFPFRNFDDEITNLKYRHFYILIKKENNNNDDDDTVELLQNYLGNIFSNKNGIIDRKKYQLFSKIKTKSENEVIKDNKKELSKYFRYNSDRELIDIYKKLKFIRDENNYLSYYDVNNKNKDNNNKNKKRPLDEDLNNLYYQILALISEGILSYYTAIDFIENILYQKNRNYRKEIFKNSSDQDYPTFFNLTLTKILNKYQNSLEEKTLSEFESIMESTFKYLYSEYIDKEKKMNELLKPNKNTKLIYIQRCIITPTYILFTPYVLDQGNRILRDFLPSTYLSMLCGFKMDNFEEGRWNNKFLIEYIKYILEEGIYIGEKNFKFFNFSQSQFRNMSCWLLTEPKEILPKTGDYSKINIVAKFGARISQTLTTTIKTINIPKDHIVEIDDVLIKQKIKDDSGKEREVQYNFSDGVGKISFDLAEEIAKKIGLKFTPSCFQGRFLGCKGVWTTMYNDFNSNIYIRPSQKKFEIKKDFLNNYFELCDYSRYIQAYLNRQVILLMKANGIKDEIFMKKLEEYNERLNNERFVLSLVHYTEWNGLFLYMNKCGINKKNDRLMRSLLQSNLQILYNDVKNKARIYIKESAYVIGIMDEYGILEYGQAFLRIKKRDLDLILNQKCTIAKCPCLHPGDLRVLDFKCYIKGDESTEKYKIFEKYENVLIFPSKGKRPHPNECSGSDLDGDNYFVFYDPDLILDDTKLFEPMNYSFDLKIKKKDNIQIEDVIEYFAEYTNLNNLGLIGDAHLAQCDKDPLGAKGKIPIKIAKKFSRAVDAPKTGDEVILSEDEEPKKFPHYMCKSTNKTYISEKILGKLYDEIKKIIGNISKKEEKDDTYEKFYDDNLRQNGWEKFGLLSLSFYRDFFDEIVNLMKKNEIKGESILLTGNNIDNDESVFSRRKNNYDLREKISDEMRRLFKEATTNFSKAIQIFFDTMENKVLKDLNSEIFFKNNLNLFASSCYIISYNFYKEFNSDYNVSYFGDLFYEYIKESLFKEYEIDSLNLGTEYEIEQYGANYYEIYENNFTEFHYEYEQKKSEIKKIIDKNVEDMKGFITESKRFKMVDKPNEENQYRILSFPWCLAGKLLSIIKFLN